MAYKRKRTTRPRRVVRRKTTRMPRRMPAAGGIVNIKRTTIETPFSVANAWGGAQWNFRLDKLPDFSEFNTVFTQYRINAVKMLFVPYVDGIDAITQANSTNWLSIPRLYAFVDRDSQPRLSFETDVLQHSKLKIVKNPMAPFTVYCSKPACGLGIATTSSVAYSGVKSGQWIACDSPSVPHYGVVTGGMIPASTAGRTLSYNVICTYYLQFKGTQ